MEIILEELKYPIGKFNWPKEVSNAELKIWMDAIESFPARLKSEVENLTDEELSMIYRPDGWNIRQVVHHCADSHSNAFTRFKLTLTEDKPTIKPYHENLWALLPDVTVTPIEWSLQMLEGLHKRWNILLRNLSVTDLQRAYIHPDHGRELKLESVVALYAWHSNHHLAHVQQAKKCNGKFE